MKGNGGEEVTRLVAVSNRLPISLERDKEEIRIRPGGGGLVSAMAPVLKNRGGVWIGWSGLSKEDEVESMLDKTSEDIGYQLHTVPLGQDEIDGFYFGFSNEVIWPLFHDLQTRCNFSPKFWEYYLQVNDKFADAVAQYSSEKDFIWVHDYHLIHLAQALRAKKLSRKTAFFLHIPFPAADIFVKLPWRERILNALIHYDLIGFQTLHDRRNFTDCLNYLMPDVKVGGRGTVVTAEMADREFRIGAFPISIDYDNFVSIAKTWDVTSRAKWLKKSIKGTQIILGVDRLDYTKGLPERLMAFGKALEMFPELVGKLTLVQIVVPSRAQLGEYRSLKAEVEQLVGEINGRYTYSGWVPVHYQYRSFPREELVANYRAASIGLVTPLKDGMNLVSKEYCACNVDEDGVLILSEFAGSASQLQGDALLVNPYDIEGVAQAIHTAFWMTLEERKERMHRIREQIRRNDIFTWVDSYLQAALAMHLEDFPAESEYVPQISLKIDNGD
ncbi:trehalose-6-phosphate synthase [Calditrichota bacterium]